MYTAFLHTVSHSRLLLLLHQLIMGIMRSHGRNREKASDIMNLHLSLCFSITGPHVGIATP